RKKGEGEAAETERHLQKFNTGGRASRSVLTLILHDLDKKRIHRPSRRGNQQKSDGGQRRVGIGRSGRRRVLVRWWDHGWVRIFTDGETGRLRVGVGSRGTE